MINSYLNWETNPETNRTETISSLSDFESAANTINNGTPSATNTINTSTKGETNSSTNSSMDETNIPNKYRVKPQFVVHNTGSVADESFVELFKPDPVRLFFESCRARDLSSLYSRSDDSDSDFYIYVPNLDFYSSFDDKLRLVCEDILDRSQVYPSYQGWKNKFDLDYDNEMRRILNGFEHQSSEDMLEHFKVMIDKLLRVRTFNVPSEFYYHIEGVCIMAAGIMSSANVGSAAAHICAFARSLSGDSVASLVKKCLDNMSWSHQSFGSDDWLSLLRQARTNWKLVLDNPHFANVQNVLSIIVSLGLCQSGDIAFTLYGVKMFSQHASKKQATAVDLLDAVLSTVVTFVEGGHECFRQGSLKPLLHGDVELDALIERCIRCDRLAEFAKTGDIERAEEGMTGAFYFKFLLDTIEELKDLRRVTRSVHTIKLIDIRIDKMQKHKIIYERTCNTAGLRVAPWAILIYGNSGVGKSSISNILMIASLKANGFPADDLYLFYNNEQDKYDSQLKSHCTGMFFDDMANTKLEFTQVAPAANIIQAVNNVRAYGNMAEADEKGKVLKEPKVVCTTTNVKNLKSTEQSECPLSIERRNAYILTVTVKEQFAVNGMLNQEKVTKYYSDLGVKVPVVPDLWLFDVEEARGAANPTPGRPDLVVYHPIIFEGKALTGVDIRTVLRYNKYASEIHFANQRALVESQTNLSDKMDWCGDCKMPGDYCCCANEMDHQFGALIASFAVNAYYSRKKRVTTYWEKFNSDLEAATLEVMMARLESLESSKWLKWTNYVPTPWLEDESVQAAILWSNRVEMRRNIFRWYAFYGFGIFFSVLTCFVFPIRIYSLIASLFVCVRCLIKFARVVHHEKTRLYTLVSHENGSMSEAFKTHRDASVYYITSGCLLLGTIYALACLWKEIRLVNLEPQGNLCPETMKDVEERDKDAAIESEIAIEQGWDQVYVAPIPCSTKSKTATTSQLCDKVYKNLTQFVWKNKAGKDFGCDLFFIESNVAIIPRHVWHQDEMKIIISRGSKRIQTFEVIISKSHSCDIEDTELCLVYIPNAGSWASLVDYLPHTAYAPRKKVPSRFIYKDMRKSVPERLECDTVVRYGTVNVLDRTYYGATYHLAFDTFSGLCMGGLISNTKETTILGFHTAGERKHTHGAMSSITKSAYEEARNDLASIPGVCLVASEGVLHPQVFGKDILTSNTIHEKSPLHKLPEDAHMDVYGTCTGRAKYYSDVVETPIADTVSSTCGFEKCFDKPKFHLGDAWEKSLLVSCKPSVGVEPSLLVHAVEDYVDSLIDMLDKIPGLAKNVHPLSRMQNVCGIDGVRFIDKLNPQTSIGYPLSGPKQKYLTLLDPEDHIDFACPAELDEMFWVEAERMESEYKDGRRCHTPFKACLKDEPTKITKDKVRTFQAAPTAFQLVIRKYFLPIVRLLSVFPLTSECAVGINTMGPEFDDLVKHMRKHGDDRIFAGDYSKYDLRMPAQLILAAFDVLIEIAQHYNYSDEDILVMRGVASDIAYPVMAYNGDLVQHYGSNPSGQNLTVYINSIVNSLLMRSAYYHIYKDRKVPCFAKAVSVMTYGDDVKGSVRIGFDEFNHLSYTAFLAERDIVFTMPDKESTPTKYMSDEDADFLKRKNVYSPDLDLWMGALDEDSIFKSLTSVKKSKSISLLEQSMQNIDGALREWFAYGRDHYEMRREQMRLVATDHSIQGGCDMLNVSFDDCLERYRTRYGLSPPCKK